jgi:hypothetical protein
VARVEADPGFPHRCLARDDRRNLLHARLQVTVTGQQLRAVEGEQEMREAQQQKNR